MSKFLPNHDYPENFLFELNFRYIKYFILVFFLILVSRLFYLQVINGDVFREFSNQNLLKSSDVYAPRGRIYDREGKVLVENLPAYKAIITPQYTTDLEKLAKDLAPALQLDAAEIMEKVKKSKRQNGPFFPVDVKLHLTRDELFQVEMIKLDHAGLDAQEFILRHYNFGPQIAHTLGYVREISKNEIPQLTQHYDNKIKFKQKDIIGKKGIEEAYDLQLRGKKGQSFVIVDAKGQQRTERMMSAIGQVLKNIPSEPGIDIQTTLDMDLQQIAYDSFIKNDRVGSLIAMTPQGEILAWVSYPSFDPNIFSTRLSNEIWREWVNNSDRPLRNKAIQDHYAPGSTFKPIVALAGLQEKVILPNQRVHAPAVYRLGRGVWHDHTKTGQGYIEVREAIERSSNVFFYKLGKELGPDRMAKYAMALGLGSPSGVPIDGEVRGHVPTREWKLKRWGEPWQDGESVNTGIGQGHLLVTAIQLAQAYSAIANDGAVYQPQLIRHIGPLVGPEEQEGLFQAKLIRNLSEEKDKDYYVSKENFEIVKQGLWRVVNGEGGTAGRARLQKPFSVSGKTGTAQVRRFSADEIYKPCEKRSKKERHNGWFVGYGSLDGVPQITVAVLTEHSCKSSAAVPIAKDVFEAFFKKYHNMRTVTHESNTRSAN